MKPDVGVLWVVDTVVDGRKVEAEYRAAGRGCQGPEKVRLDYWHPSLPHGQGQPHG